MRDFIKSNFSFLLAFVVHLALFALTIITLLVIFDSQLILETVAMQAINPISSKTSASACNANFNSFSNPYFGWYCTLPFYA